MSSSLLYAAELDYRAAMESVFRQIGESKINSGRHEPYRVFIDCIHEKAYEEKYDISK